MRPELIQLEQRARDRRKFLTDRRWQYRRYGRPLGCPEICLRHIAEETGIFKLCASYADGFKKCGRCNVFVKTEGNSCLCCGYNQLKVKPNRHAMSFEHIVREKQESEALIIERLKKRLEQKPFCQSCYSKQSVGLFSNRYLCFDCALRLEGA